MNCETCGHEMDRLNKMAGGVIMVCHCMQCGTAYQARYDGEDWSVPRIVQRAREACALLCTTPNPKSIKALQALRDCCGPPVEPLPTLASLGGIATVEVRDDG